MKKNKTKILVGLIVVLSIWVIVLITGINDYIALTGIYHTSPPKEALSPKIDPEKDYYLEEIKDGVYFLSSYSHNTMFIVTDESVVVVDALPSLGDKYITAINEVTDKPVSHLIYSHSHSDHIGAANMFGDVEIIAHKITAEKLIKANDPLRPIPTAIFEKDSTLHIGGKTIELTYHGPAHNPGNIAIYLPNEKVLTMIDIAFPKWVPIHEFAIAEDLEAYYHIYDTLLEYDFTHYIGGHALLGSYQDVADQKAYIMDIRKSANEVIGSVELTKLGKRAYNSPNTLVTVNFGMNKMACKCEEKVLEKWGDKLGYADVYTKSHCLRMLFEIITE